MMSFARHNLQEHASPSFIPSRFPPSPAARRRRLGKRCCECLAIHTAKDFARQRYLTIFPCLSLRQVTIVELCGAKVLVKQEARTGFRFGGNVPQNIPGLGASFTLDRESLVLIHTQMSSTGGVSACRASRSNRLSPGLAPSIALGHPLVHFFCTASHILHTIGHAHGWTSSSQ